MKQTVVEVTLSSKNSKRSIMKAVANLNGIKSMKIDEKQGRLTVVGTVDPVDVIEALRKKNITAQILSVGSPELEKQSSQIYPYNYDWSNVSRPAYPYYSWSDSYRPAHEYATVPYEEQPSGCIIL